MEEGLFRNPVFVNHIAEFAVAAIGHSEGHTEVEQQNPRTGEVERVCPVYHSIPCAVHQTTNSQARGSFEFRGVPASFVADSSGAMISQVPGQAPQAFIDALNAAQQRIGKPPVRGSQIARMEQSLHRGDGQLRRGRIRNAFRDYQSVASDEKLPEFIRQRGRERLQALERAAIDAVEAAKAEGGTRAVRALKRLEREFQDLEEAKAALE